MLTAFPGQGFTVLGARPDADSAILAAGVETEIAPRCVGPLVVVIGTNDLPKAERGALRRPETVARPAGPMRQISGNGTHPPDVLRGRWRRGLRPALKERA